MHNIQFNWRQDDVERKIAFLNERGCDMLKGLLLFQHGPITLTFHTITDLASYVSLLQLPRRRPTAGSIRRLSIVLLIDASQSTYLLRALVSLDGFFVSLLGLGSIKLESVS